MRVHHMNCISSCPLGGALMDRRSVGLRGRLACHCILIESNNGLVLFDTGFGLLDCANPTRRLSQFFLHLLDPDFKPELTAARQIEALGYSVNDVRHILLTHLDFDHAGGLSDFPSATVHMLHSEAEGAVAQRSWLDRQRFRPQQWASSYMRWQTYEPTQGENWFGFACTRNLPGVASDIAIVPLIGHTLGHAGLAVRTDTQWLLLAGDAYFDQDEMHPTHPRCAPGLATYQWLMDKDRGARIANQERLRQLVKDHAEEVHVICSHDPRELERDTGHQMDTPIVIARRADISPPYASH